MSLHPIPRMDGETEVMDIDGAAEDGHFWAGEKLRPFSYEHEISLDLFVIRGSALYNTQLILWMRTQPDEVIEALQGTPELVKPLVKEFALKHSIRTGTKALKLAEKIVNETLEAIKASETEPQVESGPPGPK